VGTPRPRSGWSEKNECALSLEWEVSEAGRCAQTSTPSSSLRATAVLIFPTTFTDVVTRCLGPCARTHIQERVPRERVCEWRGGVGDDSRQKQWNLDIHDRPERRRACRMHGRWRGGRGVGGAGDSEVAWMKRARSALSSSQPTRDDPTGPSAAVSRFGATHEEGEREQKEWDGR
jgi:hypothetical protein